jgi:hypothetical protein
VLTTLSAVMVFVLVVFAKVVKIPLSTVNANPNRNAKKAQFVKMALVSPHPNVAATAKNAQAHAFATASQANALIHLVAVATTLAALLSRNVRVQVAVVLTVIVFPSASHQATMRVLPTLVAIKAAMMAVLFRAAIALTSVVS